MRKAIHLKKLGSNSFTSAVTLLPSALMLAILPHMNWIGLPVAWSPARLSDHATSSAVTGLPSCHLAPWRTLRLILVLSAFQPHSVSRSLLRLRLGFWSMYCENTAL